MPWLFVPILFLLGNTHAIAHVNVYGELLAVPLSAWLGQRYDREGVVAVALAWGLQTFLVRIGDFSISSQSALGLFSVLLAYLCSNNSSAIPVKKNYRSKNWKSLGSCVAITFSGLILCAYCI